jgi:hypothetical protein
MAKNTTGIKDESGEYEDWIELYNSGSSPVNLAGLYLSGKLSSQNAWQIPSDNSTITTIPSKGYLLFTADNELSEGPLHAGFKLDKQGDAVFLFKMIGLEMIVIDSMRFGAQEDNVSWGRYPDGSANMQFLTLSTPRAANYWSPDEVGSVSASDERDKFTVFPVPTKGRLFVKFNPVNEETWQSVQLNIYSATGSLVLSNRYSNPGLIELQMNNQPPGLYLLKIISDTGVFERKLIVY